MIRVAIVADSAVLRAGLASVIGAEPGVQIVASADASDVMEREDDVDVVVMVPRRDTSLTGALSPDESDLDERVRGPATMVLLERMEASVAQEVYAAGASAVLALDAGAEELRAAVRAVASGLVVMPTSVSTELLGGARAVSSDAITKPPNDVSLTSREREVLALLAQGFANKVIASRLGITEHTVKTHIAAVYEKLGARNRAEVLVAAARHGLVIL